MRKFHAASNENNPNLVNHYRCHARQRHDGSWSVHALVPIDDMAAHDRAHLYERAVMIPYRQGMLPCLWITVGTGATSRKAWATVPQSYLPAEQPQAAAA